MSNAHGGTNFATRSGRPKFANSLISPSSKTRSVPPVIPDRSEAKANLPGVLA